MTCEVKTFGNIPDIYKVQEYFGLSHDDNWLNGVTYSISPTLELIVMALGHKFALLTACWDTESQHSTYTVSNCMQFKNPNCNVTSVLCLTLFDGSASSGAEWTCVALGQNNGWVSFYTDLGMEVYSQRYHNKAVLSVKAYTPPKHSEVEAFVYVVYDSCVCILNGCDIVPRLNNVRRKLSDSAGVNSFAKFITSSQKLQFQKFQFPSNRETIINDAVVDATQIPRVFDRIAEQCISNATEIPRVFDHIAEQYISNATLIPRVFDHIAEQCISNGLYSRLSSTTMKSYMIVGVGAKPCLGYFLAEEGYKTISEVAVDVIGNIKDNLFNVPTRSQDEQSSIPIAKEMRFKCQFFDDKRDGCTILIAPNGRLAVVIDRLDRVLLVDTQRSIILRVWKGYRDAQCAFVPVKEKSLKGVKTSRRRTLFLVIYAPRLGCLEIWPLQQGPKVAAFTVSKNGLLAYSTHGLMGLTTDSKNRTHANTCLFLDPSDASIKEVKIPFHYALSTANSATSKDIYILRRLKNLLRTTECTKLDMEEISSMAADFQTMEVRQQCLEVLLKSKQLQVHVFQSIINAFDVTLQQQIDQPEKYHIKTTEDYQQFQITVRNYKRLCMFYMEMKVPEKCDDVETLELDEIDLEIIQQLVLLLSDSYLLKQQMSEFGSDTTTARGVTFGSEFDDVGDFVDFINIFQVDQESHIHLHKDKSNNFGEISSKLFHRHFTQGLCFDQFKLAAEKSLISHKDLLVLALHNWLEKPFIYKTCEEVIADMSRLAEMIKLICELAGDVVNDYAYNTISPWWQYVRMLLLDSPKFLGLLVAIVCKTVAISLRTEFKEGSCDGGSQHEDDTFKRIPRDEAQWGLLIGKLEDIAILGAILEYPIISSEPVMPDIPYDQPDCSLKFIVSGGKEVVTDLTAKWLLNARIHPSKIVENDMKGEKSPHNKNDFQKDTKSSRSFLHHESSELNTVLMKLSLLRIYYPFSLESGSLLSLMTWHYMIYWSKNLTSLEYFRAAIDCLEQFRIRDHALKHGIACMLWQATIKIPLLSTSKLIHKVGWLPTDEMCPQDIEMSASCVPVFLELSLSFLQHLQDSLNHGPYHLKFEVSLADGRTPIQFLALQQHHATKEQLKLHYELCAVLQFISFFQLRISKPLTLVFDAICNHAPFGDINIEWTFFMPAPDMVLQQHRTELLWKAITASMDLIRKDKAELTQYMEKFLKLAESWCLDIKALRRRQIVDLYAHGFDENAEQLLINVAEDEFISHMLLEIAGRRLNIYANASHSASIGKQLLNYLKNLRDSPSNNNLQITASAPHEIDLIALGKLVNNTILYLPGKEHEYIRIAAQVYDACSI